MPPRRTRTAENRGAPNDATLRELIDDRSLRHLAGPRSYARGVDYALTDRVIGCIADEEMLTAVVQGSEPYDVRLWRENGRLRYECSCSVGTTRGR